jgi:hypothetical protein
MLYKLNAIAMPECAYSARSKKNGGKGKSRTKAGKRKCQKNDSKRSAREADRH